MRRQERAYICSVALVTLATFFFSLFWGLALPHFEGQDEREHYNSVSRLIDGGGWPRPYDATQTGPTWQAVGEAGRGLPDDVHFEELVAPSERAGFLAPTDLPDRGRDQMVQHPPGYYLVAAVTVAAAGGDGLRWDHALFVLRGLSALLFAMAIPFTAGVVRWATGSRWAGVLGAVFPLLVPWYSVSGGWASNDALLVMAVSATIYGLVRAWADPRRRTWMLAIAGIAYGVALGSKGYAMMLAPVVIVLAIAAAWRAGKRQPWSVIWRLLLPATIAFCIGGWWWVRNLIVIGTLQPSQLASRERQDVPFEGYSFETYVRTFFSHFTETFWLRDIEPGVTYAAGILLVLLLIVALAFARSRIMLALLLAYPIIIGVTLFWNAHGIYWDTGQPTRGVQGRYIFSAIAALALGFSAALLQFFGRFSGRFKSIVTVLLGVATMGIILVSMWLVLPLKWASRDRNTPAVIGDPIAFMDVSVAVYSVVLATACAFLLAGVLVGARVASKESHGTASVDVGIPTNVEEEENESRMVLRA